MIPGTQQAAERGAPMEQVPVYQTPSRGIEQLGSRVGSILERAFFVFIMVNLTGAIIPPQQGSIEVTGEGSLLDSAFALLYLFVVALIGMRWLQVTRAALAHKLTLVVLLVAGLSWFWTTAPDITLKRSVAILVTSALGWYLASRFTMREFLTLIAIALGITGSLSLFYGIVNPAVATLPSEGTWRGVYDTKNTFARIMVLSAMTFLLLGLEQRRRRWLIWAGVGLSVFLILMSQSVTALTVLLALFLTLKFAGTLRLRPMILVPTLIGLALLLAVGLIALKLHAATVASQMGKDVTMTGRTDLWAVALLMIERQPWLGYGYGGFWTGPAGPAGTYWAAVGWPTPHTHNGFIDLTLDLGLVGLTAFLLALGNGFVRAIGRARTARTADAVAPLMFLTYTVLYNLSESSLLKHNTIFWVIFVVAVTGASGGMRQPGGVPPTRPLIR